MSFQAVIKDQESKQIWCKSIGSLASIADNMKIIITKSFMSLSALNTSRTANIDIIFRSEFFDKYAFTYDTDNVIQDGFQLNHDQRPNQYAPFSERRDPDQENSTDHASYSFVILSRFLSVLFKVPDDDEYTLSINFERKCPKTHRFRLLIEKVSKKLVKKQFSPAFQPCSLDNKDVLRVYKRMLSKLWSSYQVSDLDDFRIGSDTQENSTGILANLNNINNDVQDNAVNYLILETVVLKKFLEVTPSSIEDFQINIKKSINRLHFIAFLKPIKKDKVYIRQPMSLCVSIGMEDLIDQFLHPAADQDNDVIKVTFRLKELKTFISLASLTFMLNNSGNANMLLSEPNGIDNNIDRNHGEGSMYSNGENNTFEIFFAGNGNPIVFESNLKRGLVNIKLTQITDTDENINIDKPTELPDLRKRHLPDYKIIKNARRRTEQQTAVNNSANDNAKQSEVPYDEFEAHMRQIVDNGGNNHNRSHNNNNNNNNNDNRTPLFVEDNDLLHHSSITGNNSPQTATRKLARLTGKRRSRTNNLIDEDDDNDDGGALYDRNGDNSDDDSNFNYEHQATITWNTTATTRVDNGGGGGGGDGDNDRTKRALADDEENQDDNGEDEGIGRTQLIKRVKGLFD